MIAKKASGEWIPLFLMILIILIGLSLFDWTSVEEDIIINEKDAICIAENSEAFLSSTCSACIRQKEVFGNYTDLLNIIYCDENLELCQGIRIVPTWIINGEKYSGYKSIEKLKELTGC